jgi:hypothetical protein
MSIIRIKFGGATAVVLNRYTIVVELFNCLIVSFYILILLILSDAIFPDDAVRFLYAEFAGFAEVNAAFFGFVQVDVNQAAVIIGFSEIRVKLNGIRVVADRFGICVRQAA